MFLTIDLHSFACELGSLGYPSTLVSELSFYLAWYSPPHFQNHSQRHSKHKPPFYSKLVSYTMSASMSLEEKIDDVLKNNQAISVSNQEHKDST